MTTKVENFIDIIFDAKKNQLDLQRTSKVQFIELLKQI